MKYKKEKIIIDGIDVSECCWCDSESDTEPYCRINDGEDLICEENPNCYFKQLKRKEQECEELKEKVKELHQGWINCDKERNLQEANSEFRQRVINRYRQTLSSIKNIVEEDFNHTCWETYAGQLEQILQKISEMEND